MKSIFPIALIQLDRTSSIPLYQQIANRLREAILTGKVSPGIKIPSNRDLAEMLDVSRNTAVSAVEQLVSEGYIIPKVGAGSFVTQDLPEDFLQSSQNGLVKDKEAKEAGRLSSRGEFLVGDYNPIWHIPKKGTHNLFRNGLPDLRSFPFNTWEKISRKYLFYKNNRIFDFDPDPAGYIPLRKALSEYLNVARAVKCDENQVMLVSGTEQIVYLAAKLMSNHGDKVWIEEPGFPGAARAFRAAGNTVIPVPVDDDGLDICKAMELARDAKLVYVSPSHQFPIGSTLSLKRRMELLGWAERNDAWIIEDDYDSEYRYNERPLPALQGLDNHGRVIYCGTFNLTLFPGIRLDYAVIPKGLFDAFVAARTILDIHIPTQNQAIISDFIAEGYFSRHIRRMRKLYNQRRDAIITAIDVHQTDQLIPGKANCGVYICAFLDEQIDDELVFQEAVKFGIATLPLSRFYYGNEKKMGLVLGFAACDPADIDWGIALLVDILMKREVRK